MAPGIHSKMLQIETLGEPGLGIVHYSPLVAHYFAHIPLCSTRPGWAVFVASRSFVGLRGLAPCKTKQAGRNNFVHLHSAELRVLQPATQPRSCGWAMSSPIFHPLVRIMSISLFLFPSIYMGKRMPIMKFNTQVRPFRCSSRVFKRLATCIFPRVVIVVNRRPYWVAVVQSIYKATRIYV